MSKKKTGAIHEFFKTKKSSDDKIPASAFYKQNLPNKIKIISPKETTSSDDIEKSKELALLKRENKKLKTELIGEKKRNETLAKQNEKYQNDLKQLRSLYNNACRTYVKKDMKIKMLESKIVPSSGLIFDRHKNVLGEKLLKKLRMLDSTRRSDSTFVNKCMQKLYENDRAKCLVKSADGSHGKELLTPEKKKVIEELFLERLKIEELEENEYESRVKRLNTLLNSSIHNIRRTHLKIPKSVVTNNKNEVKTTSISNEPPPLVSIYS